jgi:hypothetical protein
MPPSATLFNLNGDTLNIDTACRNTYPFVATHVRTTQSYLLLFNEDGCPSGDDVKCGVPMTKGKKCHLGRWAGKVVSCRRHDLPNGYP